MTTFGATTIQSALTTGGCHSGAKAADATSFTLSPFKGAFHGEISFSRFFKFLLVLISSQILFQIFPNGSGGIQIFVRIIIHAKSGSQYTAKNLYVKALIRLVKSMVNYARLKSQGDEAVTLQSPAIRPSLQHPNLHISFAKPEAEK